MVAAIVKKSRALSTHPPINSSTHHIIDFDMATKLVQCVVLKREAEALAAPPYPGELGQRVFEHVSADGWGQWLVRLTTIINENGLNTADPNAISLIEKHMAGFFFGEGDYGQLPSGFHAAEKPR